jgi:hypothetical protein
MLDRIRARLTFANVVSVLALFFALGGSAYAAYVVNSNSDVAPNTISGHDPPSGDHSNLIPGSVTTQDLASGSVTGGRIEAGAITGPKIEGDSLTGMLGGEWDNLVSNAGSVQRSPVGRSSAPSSARWLAPVDIKVTDFRAKIAAPPGAGNARFLGIAGEDAQNNPVGVIQCTISGATATTCHATGSLTIPAGGLFDGVEGASGSITSAGIGWFGYRVVTP